MSGLGEGVVWCVYRHKVPIRNGEGTAIIAGRSKNSSGWAAADYYRRGVNCGMAFRIFFTLESLKYLAIERRHPL